MSGLYVIVDDRDASISWAPMSPNGGGPFNSGWTYGGTDAEFMSTTIYTGYVGSTMSFWFNGTSVSVYATVDVFPITTFNFTVDGAHASTVAQNTTGTMYHQQVYSSGSLEDGEHHLELTVPNADDTGQTIEPVIDYIIYTPSQNTSLSNSNGSHYLFIDDTSPYIHYSSSGWTRNSPPNFESESDMSYNNSISMASSSGALATLYFQGSDSEATILEAWGAIPTSPSQTAILSYTVDNGAPNTVNIPPSTSASQSVVGGLAWNSLLFKASASGGGVHTLTLTAMQEGMLYLDFFLVTSPIAFIPTSNLTASFPSSLPSSSPSPSPSPSPSTPSLSSSKGSSHIGAIIGGTVGGIALIALILVAFFSHRRRPQGGEFDPPSPSQLSYGLVINTSLDELQNAPSFPTTDITTTTMPIGYSANQPHSNDLTPFNNPSDLSSHSGPIHSHYSEGELREHRLIHGNIIMGRSPQIQDMMQSSWLPASPAHIATVVPGNAPSRLLSASPGQQISQSQGVGVGKTSVPPNDDVREYEPRIQELDSGYRDSTNTMITAPPLYTYE